jgi:hypothetical protein
MPEQRIPITPEIIRQSKTITCDCGGILFRPGLVFKKISQFISPTGKEEVFPLETLICEKCGKVPNEFNTQKIIPEELLAFRVDLYNDTNENRDELSHSTHEEK